MTHLQTFEQACITHLEDQGYVLKGQTVEVVYVEEKRGNKSCVDLVVRHDNGSIDDIYRYTLQLCMSLSRNKKRQYQANHKANLKSAGMWP